LAGGAMNWSGGTMGGPLTVASNGVLNVSGDNVTYLRNALTNEGTVNYSSTYYFYVQNNDSSTYQGAIDNMAGASWDFENDPSYIACYFCSGYEAFNNAGTVEKSGGTGTSYIGLPFYNTGALSVFTGTIDFN
jgi:hypothetical protein